MHLYSRGLRYTLVLNALGFSFIVRAWNNDRRLFNRATHIPRWCLFSLGVLLQIPGLFYLGVVAWAVYSSPGTHG
jgi:hypothetical protein